MNKKGQSLVFFIILVPILAIIIALVADRAIFNYKKDRFEDVTRDILTKTLDKDTIYRLYEDNGYSTENIEYTEENGKYKLYNFFTYSRVFGFISKQKYYKAEINFSAYEENDVIIVEEQ